MQRTVSTTRMGRFIDTLRWLPGVVAGAHVATVATLFPRLIHGLYWSTDAAAPLVLAERLRGSGDVIIPHFGVWTSLWWMLATRNLPGHAHLWEATGYAFALV